MANIDLRLQGVVMTDGLRNHKVLILTATAMLAFAANSVLARLALGSGSIDAASFTLLRLGSGALTLWMLAHWRQRGLQGRQQGPGDTGTWRSAAMLFLYAICFSIAYLMLNTGTGALVLFGSVQMTMIAWALYRGERPLALQWLGWGLAIAGMVYLVLPGVTAPDPLGALLMAVAGIAWGVYSLRGQGAGNPEQVTANNFLKACPMAVAAAVIAVPWFQVSSDGVWLALLSGTVASGLGYTVWYQVLPMISTSQAATCQLSVPLIAAVAGVVFMAEPLSLRLSIAAVAILGGIALSIWTRTRAVRREPV